MPFNKDLRAGYCDVNLNMSWFWEAFRNDYNEDIDFDFDDTTEEQVEFRINYFQSDIENYANKWIVYKVFNHKQDNEYKLDMEDYCDIWEFLRDVALTFCKKYPQYAKWVDKDEEVEEDDDKDYNEDKDKCDKYYCDLHENEPLCGNEKKGWSCSLCDD